MLQKIRFYKANRETILLVISYTSGKIDPIQKFQWTQYNLPAPFEKGEILRAVFNPGLVFEVAEIRGIAFPSNNAGVEYSINLKLIRNSLRFIKL